MGTDIHAHTEYRTNKWRPWRAYLMVLQRENGIAGSESPVVRMSQELEIARNTTIFSQLGGVWSEATGLEPIVDLRGLPGDVSAGVLAAYERWRGDAHHVSWLSFQEIVDADWGEWADLSNTENQMAAILDHDSGPWFLDQIRHWIPGGLTTDLSRLRLVFWFDN